MVILQKKKSGVSQDYKSFLLFKSYGCKIKKNKVKKEEIYKVKIG